MRFSRSFIRKLDRYIHPSLADKFVRTISRFEDTTPARLARADLSVVLDEGESYLPPPIGRVSRFNAEGKWVTLRDQPKELRYVGTLNRRWVQWSGPGQTEEVEEPRDVYRQCYPRDLVAPPSEEIFGFRVNGAVCAATEAISLPHQSDRLLHQVNLMLEVFGSCEIVRADGTSASPANTTRRWVFLPSGPYKSGDISAAISSVVSGLKEGDNAILAERQEFLVEQKPQEIAQGIGGFGDYLAYVFPQFGRVVLESLRRDNAIYIFKGAWESFSRLTKREILDSGVHDARILHSTGWKERLISALQQP